MNILVTGGSGFVGLAVASAATAQGDTVTLFADRAPPEPFHRAAGGDRIDVLIGDITSQRDVAAAIGTARPSHVVHAAALTPSPASEAGLAARVIAVNVAGTAALLEAAAAAGLAHVVHLSSIAVYGAMAADEGLVGEDRPTAPGSLYGVSKCAAEMVARHLARRMGLTVTILRSGPVFGPFEYETGVRSVMSPHLQMLRLAERGVPAVLAWRFAADWIYSADIASGVLWMLAHPERADGVFNLSGASVTDLRQWGDLLAQRFAGWTWRMADPRTPANVTYGIAAERAPLDNARIAGTGFAPAYDLSAAARHMLDWSDRLRTIH